MHRSRLSALAFLLLALGGCSSAIDSPAERHTLTLEAGDQQQAAASQAVAIAPAVRLRDAASAPVAGVAVQWVVTGGGGSLTGATSQSNAQGIAQVGSWTLGASGAQTLEARVTGLTAVVFHATITSAPTTEVIKTIAPSGGTLEITTPGHPLQGLSLIVPSGTFTNNHTVKVDVATGASIPNLGPAISVVGPALSIVSDQGLGGAIMTLRIPGAATPGKLRVAIAWDPVRQVSEVLPTLSANATSITVGSRHFRGSLLLPNSLQSSGIRAGGAADDPMQVMLAETNAVLLAGAPLVPEVNGWPVADNGSSTFLTGHGAAIASLQLWAVKGQQPTAPLFGPMKVPGLYADTATFAAVLIAAKRLASFPQDVQRGLGWMAAVPAAERDQQIWSTLLVRLLSLNASPVLLALADHATNPTRVSMVIAYQLGNQTIRYFDPTEPGVSKQLTLGPSGFVPVPIRRTLDEAPVMSAAVLPMGSALFDVAQLGNVVFDMINTLNAAGPTRVTLNRLMAQLGEFPSVKLQVQATGASSGWRNTTDTLIMYSDHDRIRAVTSSGPNDILQKLVLVDAAGNQSAVSDGTGSLLASALVNFSGTPEGGAGPLRGAAVTLGSDRMLVPLNLHFAKGTFQVQDEPLLLETGEVQFFNVKSNFRFPTGSAIEWSWGDGTPKETATAVGLTDSRSHKFAFTGTPPDKFTIITRLLSASVQGQLIAADTAFVENVAAPFWRITAFADLDDLFSELDGATYLDALLRVLNSPGAGLIGVTQTGGVSELFLSIQQTGTWEGVPCCPPYSPFHTNFTLGLSPTVNHAFGPFFAAFTSSTFSQSGTDLNSGTMTGTHAPGSTQWPVKNAGTQTGPDYFVRISATRNGTTMTGTITFVNFTLSDDDVPLDASDILNFRFPFTAVRIR